VHVVRYFVAYFLIVGTQTWIYILNWVFNILIVNYHFCVPIFSIPYTFTEVCNQSNFLYWEIYVDNNTETTNVFGLLDICGLNLFEVFVTCCGIFILGATNTKGRFLNFLIFISSIVGSRCASL
jgi:hypothetical protein